MSELSNMRDTPGGSDSLSDDGQLVVFRLSDEEFGVEIGNVREIVRMTDITPIPRSPEYVAGICNLRGDVLPVIDTRTRFALETRRATDHTRLLVVEAQGTHTGLIVDSVREVMRMRDSHEEPPPDVCRGIDRQFLSSVVKADHGERLILKLDLGEVLTISASEGPAPKRERELSETGEQAQTSTGADMGEEEHLVSFRIAEDEYAFDIDRVREIIKVSEITSVPNVPPYVRGLLTIRNQLLPIIDLREMLALPSLVSERHSIVDMAVEEHRLWLENMRHVLEAGAHFTGTLNPKETPFGVWLEKYNTSSAEVENLIKRLKKRRAELFYAASGVLDMRKQDGAEAMSFFDSNVPPLLEIVIDTLEKFRNALEQHILADQRALVVKAGAMTVGFLVDWVDEVLRIPKSVIDKTPAAASSDHKEIKAVAKLDHGERLIMIMDESAVISRETSRLLSEIKTRKEEEADMDESGGTEKSLAQQSMDEVQLVTFVIDKEEYGIHIMQVQEINRLSDVTAVPRAPYFVDGMTNLRGNVIPVINIRRLFGLEERDADDRTRIIIVDIGGSKTGLRVDQVNEVLRLEKRNIVHTPDIVISEGVNAFMGGVCKLEDGKRMVVLLNVEKILDEDELRRLDEIVTSRDGESREKRLSPPPTETFEPEPEETEPEKEKLEIAE